MDPVVLVPGLQADGTSWLPLCRSLTGRLPLVLPFGHQHRDTMAAMAADVLAQSPARFHLVGWSMGGYIAFEILRRAPDRVCSVTLISTSAAPEAAAARARRLDSLRRARTDGLRRYQDDNLDLCLHDPGALEAGLRTDIARAAEAIGLPAFEAQIRAVVGRPDSRADLAGLVCPVLILTGTDDRIVPADESRDMHSRLPHARLIELPACGHCPPLERTETVSDLLLDWFGELSEAAEGAKLG